MKGKHSAVITGEEGGEPGACVSINITRESSSDESDARSLPSDVAEATTTAASLLMAQTAAAETMKPANGDVNLVVANGKVLDKQQQQQQQKLSNGDLPHDGELITVLISLLY